MNLLVSVFVGLCLYGFCRADSPTPAQPYVGEWNYTNSPHGPGDKLCMKLRAGIRLEIDYETHNGTKTAQIISTSDVIVDEAGSKCDNSTSDLNEILSLQFHPKRILKLYFTRETNITKDSTHHRWQLYKVAFDFVYDIATFPDSIEPGMNDTLSNTNTTLSGISTSTDRSFSCSKTGTITIMDRFRVSFTNLRAQAFIKGDDFSEPDHCQADQESTDLIPIIIGAALAALVIIVLIAYLIGRARANTPVYDNMK